ncbi:MAG: DUF4405 domain-containing protein [Deltaproteobacteria bacterium]|jgi:hypothetical protein|nr:DUF4405 domain-containing protein [Deltaproteobacteria bacterium]
MNKQKMLKIVNPILALDFLMLALSGIFHEMVPYEIFEKAHPLLGFTLVILVTTHIILNWSWIASSMKKTSK